MLATTPASQGRVLRIVGATDLQEPGSTATVSRLHYSLRLSEFARLLSRAAVKELFILLE